MDDRRYIAWPENVEFIAKDFGDWVACTWGDGPAVAFNRTTGRWCRLPHPDCPVIVVDWDNLLNGKPGQQQ